ncbi:MAG: 30S ribosomal protein S7 [Bacteriovoracia bacterium]
MGRKKTAAKREVQPDPKFNDIVVTKFINTLVKDGKKALVEGVFYQAIDIIQERTKTEDGIKVFKKALENAKPVLEVKSRRIGGANYQVPVEVAPGRRQSLSSRWIIEAARARTENSLAERLASEFLEASEGRGGAMKKREDVHRMADANKAFAHFRW